jgi:hypothetical protein
MRRQDETGDQADHASRPRFSLRHSPRPRRRSASRMILRGLATLLAVVLARGFKVVGAVGDAARSDYLSTVIEIPRPSRVGGRADTRKAFRKCQAAAGPEPEERHVAPDSRFDFHPAKGRQCQLGNLEPGEDLRRDNREHQYLLRQRGVRRTGWQLTSSSPILPAVMRRASAFASNLIADGRPGLNPARSGQCFVQETNLVRPRASSRPTSAARAS